MPEMPLLFSDWYDSVHQRQLVARSSRHDALEPALRCRVLGQLRWDAIRSPCRIQSYAQLLDGWVMHMLANDRLLHDIGVPHIDGHMVLPFETSNYGFTVESSLIDIAHRGFLFSSLDLREHERLAVQARVSAADGSEVQRRIERDGAANGLAGLLSDVGRVPAEESRRLAAAWQFWLDQERIGVLRTRQARTLCDDADSFAAEDFAALVVRTPAGRMIRDRIMSNATRDPQTGVRRRSLVYAEIAQLEVANLRDERADARTLKQSFDRCYHRTIARTENAMLHLRDSTGEATSLRKKVAEQQASERDVAIFPAGYLDVLGSMSADRWQEFLADIAGELRAWWSTWDVKALQGIGDRLTHERYPDLPAGRHDASRRTLTAFATVGAGAGSAFADPNLAGLAIGGGIGVLAWILTEPGVAVVGRAMRRRQQRFDLVEVWPEPAA